MRTLILLLLLIEGASAQEPKAPFINPNYDKDDKANNIVFESTIQVPRDGKIVIPFLPMKLSHAPSCNFEGGTLPGEIPIVTKEYAAIKGKAGKKMHYRCEGVRR